MTPDRTNLVLVVLAALACSALAGCGGGKPGYADDEVEMHRDAVKLTESLAGVVRNRGSVRVDECSNEGSGPVPPTTRIELSLRGARTEGQLRSTAATEMRRLGYTVDGEANPEAGDGDGSDVVISGTRDLGDGRESQLTIYLSPSTSHDFVLGAVLEPAITC